ncbi:MAG: DUF2029 domain-containing protein [Candidatus Aminicenantes bacterium]|nr:MAG: DUF2029 domain-containing protein [Candidatus Aminicenantes bacterium]
MLKVKGYMVDFEVNYEAGKRLSLGETLYRVEDGHYMFKYLPASSILYLPLSYLPLDAAKAIWYFLVLFCCFSLVYLSYRILPSREIKSIYVIVIPPLILAKFYLREIHLGQINALVTKILLLMIWIHVSEKKSNPSKKEIFAGLCWGLGTALKPYALIFFPYFIVKKKWKCLLSGIGLLLIALLAPSLFYGFRGNMLVIKEWASSLSQSTPSLITAQDNISILAFFTKWTGNQNISLVLSGFVIVFLASLVLFLVLKGKEISHAAVLECSVLLILIPLISPLGWDYTLLISVLGLMIIINNFFRYTKLWRGVLIVNFCIISLTFYDIMGRELYAAFMSWSVITINFLIIIGYLTYIRVRKIC